MQMMPEDCLLPYDIEQIKKDFLDKYQQLIPNLKERIEDVFWEAMVIFTANYKLGRLTGLKAPMRDYVVAIMLKMLLVDGARQN